MLKVARLPRVEGVPEDVLLYARRFLLYVINKEPGKESGGERWASAKVKARAANSE